MGIQAHVRREVVASVRVELLRSVSKPQRSCDHRFYCTRLRQLALQILHPGGRGDGRLSAGILLRLAPFGQTPSIRYWSWQSTDLGDPCRL
jgi:hypothetical protein